MSKRLGRLVGVARFPQGWVAVVTAREPAQGNREFKRAGRQELPPDTSRLAAATESNNNPLDICRLC